MMTKAPEFGQVRAVGFWLTRTLNQEFGTPLCLENLQAVLAGSVKTGGTQRLASLQWPQICYFRPASLNGPTRIGLRIRRRWRIHCHSLTSLLFPDC